MRFAIAFILLGSYLAVEAAAWGSLRLLLLWPAVSFLLVGAAYGRLGPAVFGKRRDGTMAWWATALLLPYLLLAWGVWHVQRLLSRERIAHEVVPGVWIGRRPLAGEIPDGVATVVDLTAEFPACRPACAARSYVCLPTLDACSGDASSLRDLARDVASRPGPLFIHCAQGRGRSAMLTAAVLIARGDARDADEALAIIRRARPGVRLSGAQREALEGVADRLAAERRLRADDPVSPSRTARPVPGTAP